MSSNRDRSDRLRDWEDDLNADYTMEELIEANEGQNRGHGDDVSTSGREGNILESIEIRVSESENEEDSRAEVAEEEEENPSSSSIEVVHGEETDDTVDSDDLSETDVDITKYPPPPRETPDVAARMVGKVDPDESKALKNYSKFRKDFCLKGYKLYYRSSLRARARYGGIIVCKPYFTCGFRLPMGDLTVSCLNRWYKAPNQFAGNVYTTLSVLEGLNATGQYQIGPIDVVSLFSVRMLPNHYFTFYRRSGVPAICKLDSKPHYIESTALEVVGNITTGDRELLWRRPFNTCEFMHSFSFPFTFLI